MTQKKKNTATIEINGINVTYDFDNNEYLYEVGDFFGLQQSVILLAENMYNISSKVISENQLSELMLSADALKSVAIALYEAIEKKFFEIEFLQNDEKELFEGLKNYNSILN